MIDPGSGPRLYNLERDIGEQRNVIAEYPRVARRLKQEYANWLDEMEEPQNWPAEYWQGRMKPKAFDHAP